MNDAKLAVENTFTKRIMGELWTSSLLVALPVTPQSFSLPSVLPAVLYMLRHGRRRGPGRFFETFSFSTDRHRRPNIRMVVYELLRQDPAGQQFEGFDDEAGRCLLSDLLLGFCLENKKHAGGHDIEVQRVYPTHYMASWIDLPPSVANLRFVPEMLVATLAWQHFGRKIIFTPENHSTEFAVGRGIEPNLLLRVLAPGMSSREQSSDLSGDVVNEEVPLSVDQLLMLRLAQACGSAPAPMPAREGFGGIPNGWPLAARAATIFRKDLQIFLSTYAEGLPRQALVSLLETLLGLGLFEVFTGTLQVVCDWDRDGGVPDAKTQQTVQLFADASVGTDHELRRAAEDSFASLLQLIDRAPVAAMALRLLDTKGRYDRILRDSAPDGPDSAPWVTLLGSIRAGSHPRSEAILNDLEERCQSLQQEVEESFPAVAELLANRGNDPVAPLAEALVGLMGEKAQRLKYVGFLDSCLLPEAPNGLGRKRRIILSRVVVGKRTAEARSMVLTNSLLEVLAHRYLAPDPNHPEWHTLSLPTFLDLLAKRYGLLVDRSPPGMSISDELLRRNRLILERRLRDLGLITGVNDAESMKLIRPRYRMKEAAYE